MKNFYNIKVLLLVCLFATFGFLQSCNDDEEDVNSGQVELLSFGPTGAKHGEKLKFIGHNLNKVESIEFVGASVAKTQFTSQSSDLIELVIPNTAEEGRVTLKVSGGEDVVSKTVLSFEVPVTIASVTAKAKPGTNITVTGNYLNWVDSVQFGTLQDSIVTTFVSKSMTELVLRVPMSAKTGSLTFFTGGTEPMAIETEQSLDVTLPTATAFSPASLKHGENLTITGTDLDLVKEIVFTGVGTAKATSFVSQSATQIVVTVPDNASAGTLKLVAKSGVEMPTTQSITITLPAITSMSPNPVDPGANLTITGTNLDLVKSVNFTGGASVSNFVSKSPTQIVLKMPTQDILNGVVTFITTRNYSVATGQTLRINIDRPPYFIYNDALNSEWQLWGGWGKSSEDVANAEQVSRGAKAIKVSFNDAYGAFQLHPNNANVFDGYTTIVLYVRGTVNSRGAIQIKNMSDVTGTDAPFDIVAGQYRRIEVPISALGNITGGIKEFYIKNYGTNPNTFYIDDIELR
ncbi:IPT/TIG domain-containing protein [Rufibacter aurantiacus]|uniref:IPT/TIG domain-containing protein n=1 Tax=Rufibacter aurantiacus TaxID=2817374 RepID=UPI001B302509|nr:IPT/TIG domain-containing protein [Rufibacter aurantiacus]